MKKKERFEKCR